jgi:hypothetical protein
VAKKKAKSKKTVRCIRKTKDGKRCKSRSRAGLKTCASHAPKKTAKKATKKKAKKSSAKRCKMLITSGRRCKCYCKPGSVYCVSHKGGKKAKKKTKKKARRNPLVIGGGSRVANPWRR